MLGRADHRGIARPRDKHARLTPDPGPALVGVGPDQFELEAAVGLTELFEGIKNPKLKRAGRAGSSR